MFTTKGKDTRERKFSDWEVALRHSHFINELSLNDYILSEKIIGIRKYIKEGNDKVIELKAKLYSDIKEWINKNPDKADEATDYFAEELIQEGGNTFQNLHFESMILWLFSLLEYNLKELSDHTSEYIVSEKLGSKRDIIKEYNKHLIKYIDDNNVKQQIKLMIDELLKYRIVRNAITHNNGRIKEKDVNSINSLVGVSIDNDFKVNVEKIDFVLKLVDLIAKYLSDLINGIIDSERDPNKKSPEPQNKSFIYRILDFCRSFLNGRKH